MHFIDAQMGPKKGKQGKCSSAAVMGGRCEPQTGRRPVCYQATSHSVIAASCPGNLEANWGHAKQSFHKGVKVPGTYLTAPQSGPEWGGGFPGISSYLTHGGGADGDSMKSAGDMGMLDPKGDSREDADGFCFDTCTD